MDIVTLAFTFLMQNPDLAISGARQLMRPGAVDVSAMSASFADLTRGILHCYHRTARYQVADVIQIPWTRQDEYAATKSAVISIKYAGVTGARYEMTVAILSKDKLIRTAVLRDTASIPYSKSCQLENWIAS